MRAARSEARKRALDILYAAELRGEEPVAALEQAVEAGDGPAHPYTGVLVRGVAAEQHRIDELLARYAHGWELGRMPAVDRNVLRLGIWELLYADDVPDGVAIAEAMALVRDLSTDESPVFVNGVLGGIMRDKPALAG